MTDDTPIINNEPEVDTDRGDDLSSEAFLPAEASAKVGAKEDEAGEDFVFEDNTEVTGADYSVQVKKLKARIKELEQKNTELLNNWQRDKADFLNARRLDAENQKNFAMFAKEDIATEIIPVLDSFDSAFKNKEAWEKVDKNWRVGVEYIHSQLVGVLSNHGVSVINPLGEMYDHNRDEAIERS